MKVFLQTSGIDTQGCYAQYALYDPAVDPTTQPAPPPLAGPFLVHLPLTAITAAQMRAAIVADAQAQAQAYQQQQTQTQQQTLLRQVVGTVVATV